MPLGSGAVVRHTRWTLAALAVALIVAYSIVLPPILGVAKPLGLAGKLLIVCGAVAVFGWPAFVTGRWIDELRAQSRTDSLTGVGNRRFIVDRLSQELARARRTHLPLSVLMIDVNELKRINDGYGHGAGDAAIRAVASAIVRSIRGSDTVGRFGGDEFVVIAPDTMETSAQSLADRISNALAVDPPHVNAVPPSLVRVSIGIATSGFEATSPSALLERADRAMYRAKLVGDVIRESNDDIPNNMLPFRPVSR